MIQENDYNLIKPVENLPNVGALAPIDKHAEKKRQQQGRKNNRRTASGRQDLSDARQDEISRSGGNPTNSNSIDYRA